MYLTQEEAILVKEQIAAHKRTIKHFDKLIENLKRRLNGENN